MKKSLLYNFFSPEEKEGNAVLFLRQLRFFMTDTLMADRKKER